MNSSDSHSPDIYPGLSDAMSPNLSDGEALEAFDVSDDMSAEQETLFPNSPVGLATAKDVGDLNNDFAQLQVTLLEASKGVTEGTDAEYKRSAAHQFLLCLHILTDARNWTA
jgi:hypothetical protein